MLRKIEKIRGFGVFDDFSGSGLQEFRDFNLIFGFNYSGKTTLSRAFACIENNAVNSDHAAAELLFSDDGGASVAPGAEHPIKVRVYNEDFRKRHLKWDERDGIAPVAIIGEEAIETRALIEEQTKRGQQRLRWEQAFAKNIEKIRGDLDDKKKKCAKRIKEDLSIPDFTKAKISRIMAKWGSNPPPARSGEEMQQLKARLNAEEKSTLPRLTVERTGLDTLWNEAIATLGTRIGSASTIGRLVEHPAIGQWVGEGLALHEDATRCEFCNNPLSPDRLAALNAHFSNEHARLMTRIDKAIAALRSRLPDLGGRHDFEDAFYKDFQQKQADRLSDLNRASKDLKAALDAMIERLETKSSKPFDVVDPPEKAPDFPGFLAAVDAFDAVIAKNNERTDNLERNKQDAQEALTAHIIVTDLLTPENKRIERLCVRRETVRGRLAAESRALTRRIAELRASISSAAAGAAKLNETLDRFFGPGHFRFEAVGEQAFRLFRRGQADPRNLSEGERTGIAFCYFITRLFADGPDISDTIVYIDDPISSLDANHLHYVDAFIKETFYRRVPEGERIQGRTHECKAKQVFISTHNSEFFHIMWMWLGKIKAKARFKSAYMIERKDVNGRDSSNLIDCPTAFWKYRSIYLMSFERICHFVENPIDHKGEIFSIGNFIRKFLEGYTHLKYMGDESFETHLEKLIPDNVERSAVARFANSGSHLHSSGGVHDIQASTEAARLVTVVLDAVKADDPRHYAALEAALGR